MTRRAGLSPLISIVLAMAIVTTGVSIVVTAGLPQLEKMEETAAIQSSINTLSELDARIKTVASEGRYASRTLPVSFQHGSYDFDAETGEIYYELETSSELISTHASTFIGPVRVRADADVTVHREQHNGANCYRMENEYLSACVLALPGAFNPETNTDVVGYWRFDGTGQTVVDSSRYGNNGTLGINSSAMGDDPVRQDTGAWNRSARFDGVDDRVNISYDGTLDLQQDVSVSAWVRMAGGTGENQFVASKFTGQSTSQNQYSLFYQDSGDRMAFEIYDGGYQTVYGTTDIDDGDWHHVAGTYNSTHLTVWVDGTRENILAHSGAAETDNSGWLEIGNAPDPGQDRFFNGSIDEVRAHNRSLSSQEITELYWERGKNDILSTGELLVDLTYRPTGTALDGTILPFIAGNDAAATGRIAVEAETGAYRGRGLATATVLNTTEQNYTVSYRLLSGADFLTLRTRGDEVDEANTRMTYVMDDRTDDTKIIDDAERTDGTYDTDDIDFGYGVGEGSDLMSGLVAGNGFQTLIYEDNAGNGMYEYELEQDAPGMVLIPFTNGTHELIEDRESLIRPGVVGRGQFFSYPAPRFRGELRSEKTIRAGISYDRIHLNGPDRSISPGTYRLTITNNGAANGRTNITVRVK